MREHRGFIFVSRFTGASPCARIYCPCRALRDFKRPLDYAFPLKRLPVAFRDDKGGTLRLAQGPQVEMTLFLFFSYTFGGFG